MIADFEKWYADTLPPCDTKSWLYGAWLAGARFERTGSSQKPSNIFEGGEIVANLKLKAKQEAERLDLKLTHNAELSGSPNTEPKTKE